MRRRDISKVLFATAAGSTVGAQRVEAQSCTAPCYAQTPAEQNAVNPVTGLAAPITITPANTVYLPGDIRRYGASTSLSADNSVALQNAINQAIQTGGAPVRIPSGTWKYATGLVLGPKVSGFCSIYGDNIYTSILQKTADVVGLMLADGSTSGYAAVDLQSFTLASTVGGSHDGLQVNTASRVRARHMNITGHGGHGINIIQGDVSRFDDISTVSNGGDGIRLTGSGAVQANASVFTNIDTRGNTGWGFNLIKGMSNMGIGITCQSNAAGGIQVDACFGNHLTVYCESNTGPDISFTSNCAAPSFGGNQIIAAFTDKAAVFAGNSGLANSVWTMKPGPTFQPMFSRLLTDLLFFANQRTDGTEPLSTYTMQHTLNNILSIISGGAAGNNKGTVFSDSDGNVHYVQADVLAAAKAAISLGSGVLALGSTSAGGATAGSAGALPANPAGYINAYLGNTPIKIPYYNS